LKTVGKNNKNTASHYGNLGFVYLKKGDRKEASKCFKKVVNISKKLNIERWVTFFTKKIEQIKK
jgi:Tfp pilus assembly protein PilF